MVDLMGLTEAISSFRGPWFGPTLAPCTAGLGTVGQHGTLEQAPGEDGEGRSNALVGGLRRGRRLPAGLELKLLRLFEKHGLEVEKQVAVGPDELGPNISVADFVVKGTKIAIYIDGAAFHVGERLRRDEYIRDQLKSGSAGWKVVELMAKDLGS